MHPESDATVDLERRSMLSRGGALLATAALVTAGESALGNTRLAPQSAPERVNPEGRFKGKTVLITGATSGIGEGTARAFAKEGAKVFFNGRRDALGKQVASQIQAFGGEAAYFQSDVRKESQVKAFVDACIARYGGIDIAFNNAGIVNPSIARLHEFSEAEFMDCVNTNMLGEFLCMKYEIPEMLKRGGGIIVNMASVSGYRGFMQIGPYSVSKHGVVGLTKVAALEYAKDNIRITSIAPGGVDTPMLRAVREKRGMSFEQGSKAIPIQRTNTVEEMARTVMFLASDDASAWHGSMVDVTSGMLD